MVRLKYRYLAVRLHPSRPGDKSMPTERGVYDNLLENIQKYYGDFGTASIKQSFQVKYVNQGTKSVIIRVRHGPHRFLTSILPLLTNPNRYQLIGTAATIKNCMKSILADHNNTLRKCPLSDKKVLLDMYQTFLENCK